MGRTDKEMTFLVMEKLYFQVDLTPDLLTGVSNLVKKKQRHTTNEKLNMYLDIFNEYEYFDQYSRQIFIRERQGFVVTLMKICLTDRNIGSH